MSIEFDDDDIREFSDKFEEKMREWVSVPRGEGRCVYKVPVHPGSCSVHHEWASDAEAAERLVRRLVLKELLKEMATEVECAYRYVGTIQSMKRNGMSGTSDMTVTTGLQNLPIGIKVYVSSSDMH